MKLRINPLVAEDLRIIKNFIAEDNLEAATRTVADIYDCFENIQQFPNAGAALAKRVRFKTDYKYVVHGDYIIVYKVGKEYVEIYRVIDRFQDITAVLFK